MLNYSFPMGMSDELAFHTILFATTMHIGFLGKGYGRESAELLQTIIREINRRISDAGNSANYSDGTIFAVYTLAIVEVFCTESCFEQLLTAGVRGNRLSTATGTNGSYTSKV